MGSDPLTNEIAGASLPVAVTNKHCNFGITAASVDAIGYGADASLGALLGMNQSMSNNPFADFVPVNMLCVILGNNPTVAGGVSETLFANLSDTLTMRSLKSIASAGPTRYLLQTGALYQQARTYFPTNSICFQIQISRPEYIVQNKSVLIIMLLHSPQFDFYLVASCWDP